MSEDACPLKVNTQSTAETYHKRTGVSLALSSPNAHAVAPLFLVMLAKQLYQTASRIWYTVAGNQGQISPATTRLGFLALSPCLSAMCSHDQGGDTGADSDRGLTVHVLRFMNALCKVDAG